MFSALGHEARLAIVRQLLSAYPQGLVVGEIQQALGIPASTLSHHLDALRQVGLVEPHREGKYLRYKASAVSLQDLLNFMYSECCARSHVVPVSALSAPGAAPDGSD
jgi:DNA-binding transcriptional ArsR family regulator